MDHDALDLTDRVRFRKQLEEIQAIVGDTTYTDGETLAVGDGHTSEQAAELVFLYAKAQGLEAHVREELHVGPRPQNMPVASPFDLRLAQEVPTGVPTESEGSPGIRCPPPLSPADRSPPAPSGAESVGRIAADDTPWIRGVCLAFDQLVARREAMKQVQGLIRQWAAQRADERRRIDEWGRATDDHAEQIRKNERLRAAPDSDPPEVGYVFAEFGIHYQHQAPMAGWGPQELTTSAQPKCHLVPPDGGEASLEDLATYLSAMHDRHLGRCRRISPWGWNGRDSENVRFHQGWGIESHGVSGQVPLPNEEGPDCEQASAYAALVDSFAFEVLPQARVRAWLGRVTDALKPTGEATGQTEQSGAGGGAQAAGKEQPQAADAPVSPVPDGRKSAEKGKMHAPVNRPGVLPDVSRFTHPIRHTLALASDADLLARHRPDSAAEIGEFWAGARLDEYDCQAPDADRDEYLEAFRKLANQAGRYLFGRLRVHLDPEVPSGFCSDAVRAESSDSFADCWLLFLHVLGWQEPRATTYPCECEWLSGHSLEDERYCLRSSLPDVVSGTTDAILYGMADHARHMLQSSCTTRPEDPGRWRERFGLPDLSERMAFSEDLPPREHAITASLYELADGAVDVAKCLCEQFPLGIVISGEDSVGYEEIVAGPTGDLDETARRVWSQPGLGPSHAEDLRRRFTAIEATARQYPDRLEQITAEYRRRVTRVLMIYLREFGGDFMPFHEAIRRQGGLDDGLLPMRLPGVRREPKTIPAIAQEFRLAYRDRSWQRQDCQSNFRNEVLEFVELLVMLNNGIVASCSPAAPSSATSSQDGQEAPGAALSEGAANAPSSSGPGRQAKPKGMSKQARALAVKTEHPDWTDAQVAEAAGCHVKSLYRWKLFRKVKGVLRSGRDELPQGRKAEDKPMEAWEDEAQDDGEA